MRPFRKHGPVLSERGRVALACVLTAAAALIAAVAAIEPSSPETGEPLHQREPIQ